MSVCKSVCVSMSVYVCLCVCLYVCVCQENVKYAVRLRNRGQRTRNGDAGMTRVKCTDGTVFTFSSCSLSSNGTNQSRGQIPIIYYYRYDDSTGKMILQVR